MCTNAQDSGYLNNRAHLSSFLLLFVFFFFLTSFLSCTKCTNLYKACARVYVCEYVHGSEHLGIHVSADGFWRTFFPFKEHKRYYSASYLWSSSSQEKATGLLSEDGQSRWLTTVCDCESDDKTVELISLPPFFLSVLRQTLGL